MDVVKFAFVAGEVAPSYYGRADLEKYDLALAQAENFFVDYRGGLSNVPGTEFVDFLMNDAAPIRVFPFKFSSSVANKYLVIFGDGYIRFVQDGAYVLETALTVSALTRGTQTQLTVASHGLTSGDWVQVVSTGETVELVNRTCIVEVVNSSTIILRDHSGNNIDSSAYTALVSGMTIARIYTLSHSYSATDLSALKFNQIRDNVRITHPSYKIQNLKRVGHTNWTLTEETFTKPIGRPTGLTLTTVNAASGAGYSAGYVVTAVDANGIEGLPCDMVWVENSKDMETDRDCCIQVNWTIVSGADYYNVYRTRVVRNSGTGSIMNRGYQLGYIGQVRGSVFDDTGITPDFTKTPPINRNPFARGSIKLIRITNGGTGYPRTASLTVTDPNGSGFIGSVVVDSGVVSGFIILDGGSGYTNPTVTVGGGGTGFTYTVDLNPLVDVDPAVSTIHQQRQIYAAPNENPLTVYGSRPGQLSDFSTSPILVASDSFSHEIDSNDFSPIRHLISVRGGIIAMSAGGIWLMSGSENGAITATDVQADANVYTGVSDVVPLKIDTDILYTSGTGGRVNALAYQDQYKLYTPTDISILANHLIDKKRIISWAYADEPHRLIYAVREDGVMLLLTMIKEQEVFAWTRRVTRGQYLDVATFDGDGETDVYFIVRRKINGVYRKVIERLATRALETQEDAWFLDCALGLPVTYPEAELEIAAATGTGIAATATSAVFTSAHVGAVLRFGGGKARVTSVQNAVSATLDIITDFDQLEHYSTVPRLAQIGEWTLDIPATTISGLYHLEGQTVTALADGNVIRDLVVSGGAVTLPQSATRVVVGIPYKSVALNLPLTVQGTVVENKRKRVTGLAMRLLDTRGIRVGNKIDELYAPRSASMQVLGEANPAFSGITHTIIEPVWGEEGQSYIVQKYPLPATILGYILEVDVGDD